MFRRRGKVAVEEFKKIFDDTRILSGSMVKSRKEFLDSLWKGVKMEGIKLGTGDTRVPKTEHAIQQ